MKHSAARRHLTRALYWLAPFGLLIYPPTHAAGFDCAQARTAVERLICGDAKLSTLDDQMNASYQKIGKLSDDRQKRQLTTEQRRWLAERNRCTDLACLYTSYNTRLYYLDPLSDHKVTCEEMRKHPERVFDSGGINPGSGIGSPVDVDYDCPESLYNLDFMQGMVDLERQIRSEPAAFCGGTMTDDRYLFSMTEAGFVPRKLLEGWTGSNPGMDWASFSGLAYGSGSVDVFGYLKHWSEASPANYRLYERLGAEYERVLPLLVRHFERASRLSRAESLAAAKSLMTRIVEHAAGSFPRESFEPASGLVRQLRVKAFDAAEFTTSSREYPESELYEALTVALLQREPLATIEALGAKLDLADPARFGEGREPLLSFAVGDERNLDYLLRRGAPIDVANDFGKTALFYAIGESRHEAVQLLLRRGADVNHAYKSARELLPDGGQCTYADLKHTRRTPLMHAAQNSDVAMVKILIEARADTAATDDLGFNAMDYAAMAKNTAVAAYLKSLGMNYAAPK